MTDQNRIEERIADALYGELSEADCAELDEALADNLQLQAEFEALREFVSRIPADQPALNEDLLPAIRAKLNARPPVSVWRRVLVPLAAAAVVALSVGLAYFAGDTEPAVDTVAVNETDNLIERALARADELMAQGDSSEAESLLNDALVAKPLDPLAGQVALRLADMLYGQRRYPEALEAYRRVAATAGPGA